MRLRPPLLKDHELYLEDFKKLQPFKNKKTEEDYLYGAMYYGVSTLWVYLLSRTKWLLKTLPPLFIKFCAYLIFGARELGAHFNKPKKTYQTYPPLSTLSCSS